MSIVNLTYFQAGSLYIPNNNNLNVEIDGVPNSGNELQLFIDIYERELLINALGIDLYNDFQSELPAPTTQKWIDLLNGKDYSINGKNYRWDGLIGVNKQSLIAFYIYCKYLRNNQSVYTTAGVVLPNSANSENVDATPKYIFSYNNFINKYQGEIGEQDNYSIITNCYGNIGLDYYVGSNKSYLVSMYQYMVNQNTLDDTNFPDLDFKFYYRENSWGI